LPYMRASSPKQGLMPPPVVYLIKEAIKRDSRGTQEGLKRDSRRTQEAICSEPRSVEISHQAYLRI
jgi:hypothetical protein